MDFFFSSIASHEDKNNKNDSREILTLINFYTFFFFFFGWQANDRKEGNYEKSRKVVRRMKRYFIVSSFPC